MGTKEKNLTFSIDKKNVSKEDGIMDGKMTLNEMALFKKLYKKATKEGASSFQFKGIEVVTTHAKYVIEYFSLAFAQ